MVMDHRSVNKPSLLAYISSLPEGNYIKVIDFILRETGQGIIDANNKSIDLDKMDDLTLHELNSFVRNLRSNE